MQIGVVLPQTEIGNDPGAIAAYASGAVDPRPPRVLSLIGGPPPLA